MAIGERGSARTGGRAARLTALAPPLALGALIALGALLLAVLAYGIPRSARLDFDQPARALGFAGFSGVERLADGRPFRWSRPEARLDLPNPGLGPLAWRLVLAAGPRQHVPLTISVGGVALPPIDVDAAPRVYRLLVPQRQGGQHIALLLESPPAPDTGADRRLGVVVGPLAFATAGPSRPPLALALALALAALGACALLRQAGLGPTPAAALALVCAALFALAQSLWLWRWGLSLQLLGALGVGSLAGVVVERLFLPSRETETTSSSRSHPWQPALPAAALMLGTLLTRLPLLGLSDPSGDINTAADRAVLLANEGLTQAYRRGNDYLALRQYLLLALGATARALGISLDEPLSYAASALLKAPQLLADLACVVLVYGIARRWRSPRGALVIAALYALTPPIWMNASWWGQVDSILILGMLLALVLLRRSPMLGWLAWGLALQVKAQPILLLPALGAATLRLHRARGVAAGGGVMLAALALGAVPLVAAGQTAGLLDAYEGAVGRYPYTSVSAYNLWSLVHGVRGERDGAPLLLGLSPLYIGLLLLALVVVAVVAALLRRADLAARLEASAVLALAFFTLTTQMHQRYIVFVFPFLALRAAGTPSLWVAYALLAIGASLNIFGTLPFVPPIAAAISGSPLPTAIALLNLGVLCFLVGRLVHGAWRRGDRRPGG